MPHGKCHKCGRKIEDGIPSLVLCKVHFAELEQMFKALGKRFGVAP